MACDGQCSGRPPSRRGRAGLAEEWRQERGIGEEVEQGQGRRMGGESSRRGAEGNSMGIEEVEFPSDPLLDGWDRGAGAAAARVSGSQTEQAAGMHAGTHARRDSLLMRYSSRTRALGSWDCIIFSPIPDRH